MAAPRRRAAAHPRVTSAVAALVFLTLVASYGARHVPAPVARRAAASPPPASSTAPAATATAEPAGTTAPEASAPTFHCAVSGRVPTAAGVAWDGAYVVLPSGTAGEAAGAGQVALHGAGTFPVYDTAAGRWVAAPGIGAVAPDGSRYAWEQPVPAAVGSLIHVSAPDGHDVAVTEQPLYHLLGWAGAAPYATVGSGGVAALYRVDPATGLTAEVAAVSGQVLLGPDAAWVLPPPPTGGDADTLVRVDLGTGLSQVWLSTPGQPLRLAGWDPGGHPLVLDGAGAAVVLSAGDARPVQAPPAFAGGDMAVSPAATWFLDASGLGDREPEYRLGADDSLTLAGTVPRFVPVAGGRTLEVYRLASPCY